jgi:hypothetical protein
VYRQHFSKTLSVTLTKVVLMLDAQWGVWDVPLGGIQGREHRSVYLALLDTNLVVKHPVVTVVQSANIKIK